MKTLKIYGASDDLIEAEGLPGCDEFDADGVGCCQAKFEVTSGDDSIIIHAVYDGAWCFAVGSGHDRSDYSKMPDWKITRTWGADTPYSETLLIECPDDAELQDLGTI